jgi:hypothetical protein
VKSQGFNQLLVFRRESSILLIKDLENADDVPADVPQGTLRMFRV